MWFYSTLVFGLISSLCNGNVVLGRMVLDVTRLNSQTVFSVAFKVAPCRSQWEKRKKIECGLHSASRILKKL
jgi:hypothetical protein